MKALYDLKEKLMKELEPMSRKNDMNSSDLDIVHKLTDTIKNIDKICMYEEDGGFSHDGSYDGSYRGGTYNSYDGASMRGGRSYGGHWEADMRGNYGHDGASGRHYVRGHYSRDGDMTEKLERMMSEAGSEKERDALRRCMEMMR